MFTVGITGGIGSGKTTVAKILLNFGIPVYFSDERAKEILNTDKSLKSKISKAFSIPLTSEGEINRKKLAEIVFSNPEMLEKLNAMVHPKVAEDFKLWVAKQNAPYVLKEAAILLESGSYKSLDRIIVVEAPEDVRISRVMHRDSVDKDAVLNRIKNQWSDKKKRSFADFIIKNDDGRSLIIQTSIVHKSILDILS